MSMSKWRHRLEQLPEDDRNHANQTLACLQEDAVDVLLYSQMGRIPIYNSCLYVQTHYMNIYIYIHTYTLRRVQSRLIQINFMFVSKVVIVSKTKQWYLG